MDSKFEAGILLDQQTFADFQRSYLYANPLTTLTRILSTVTLLFLTSQFENSVVRLGVFTFTAVYLISRFVLNKTANSTQYKRMLLSNNGRPNHARYCFLDTEIRDTNQDTGNVFTYRYDQIRQLISTPKLLLVVLDYRLCVIVDKDKITGGTPEELMEFLLQKSPNMKRKKVRSVRFGKLVSRIFTVTQILVCIWALLNIPGISLMNRLSGELPNTMSYREMAQELDDLGICITERTIEELETYDADYLAQSGREFYRDNPRESKIRDLLYWEGSGVYDSDTMEWTPSTSGICWMDMEVWNVAAMYSDLLTGLDAMSDGITVTNFREEYPDADPEKGTGNVKIQFDLNGTQHSLDAAYHYDWLDTQIVIQLGQILEHDRNPEDLYVADDGGQGLYFFYGGEDTVKSLSRLSGLEFCPASQLYTLY